MDGNQSSRLAPISLWAKDSNPFQWMPQIIEEIAPRKKKRQEAAKSFPALVNFNQWSAG
jgi:hypothetical protein